jgi:trehalose-6-phosphatase
LIGNLATKALTFTTDLNTMVSAAFADRPQKKLVLFDVDGTLTPARQVSLYRVIVQIR